MKNITTIILNDYLNAFNIAGIKNATGLINCDANYIGSNEIYSILREKTLKYSKNRSTNIDVINELGRELTKSLTTQDRALVILYFIQSIHIKSSNELEAAFEEMIYMAGQSLGFEYEHVKAMIDFYLNDQPYLDNLNAAYFVQTREKFTFRQIGMNTIPYEKNHITYAKYLPKINIVLSKCFYKELDRILANDLHSTNNIRIMDDMNYDRADFGFYSFNELCETIENFNPLGFYELAAKENLPKIVLDPELNKIIIAGNSAPLSPTNFFNPVLDWIKAFKENNREELKVYIMLDYFNTYTSKFLMRLTKECQSLSQSGCATKIYWYCDVEDEDMTEFGENLHVIFKKGVELCYNNQELVA
jgi:hypothetical protein